MNYRALAPKWYKRSVISGFVYRIHRACSSGQNLHDSLGIAKRMLEKNQYSPSLYDPIIKKTLDSIIGEVKHPTEKSSIHSNTRPGKIALFMQYRGKCTMDYARALHISNAPCTIIMTLKKLKTVSPSLSHQWRRCLKAGLFIVSRVHAALRAMVAEPADFLSFA